MRYNKQPTDITTQLAMLKQRGLIVSDEDTALKQLASISYFHTLFIEVPHVGVAMCPTSIFTFFVNGLAFQVYAVM